MAPDAPEPPHLPHKSSNLPRWLEWTTAISALVISVCSIGVAVYNTNIESKLLKANSYPHLFGGVSDVNPNGADRISLDLVNNGVGPASEHSLKVKIKDRYVTDVKDLVRTVIGPAEGDKAAELLKDYHNGVRTRFIAAKDSQFVFRIDKTPQNARYWDLLAASQDRNEWQIEYCYCSVFDECWAAIGEAYTPVKACKRDEPNEFKP
jgi:hypothetical protein